MFIEFVITNMDCMNVNVACFHQHIFHTLKIACAEKSSICDIHEKKIFIAIFGFVLNLLFLLLSIGQFRRKKTSKQEFE